MARLNIWLVVVSVACCWSIHVPQTFGQQQLTDEEDSTEYDFDLYDLSENERGLRRYGSSSYRGKKQCLAPATCMLPSGDRCELDSQIDALNSLNSTEICSCDCACTSSNGYGAGCETTCESKELCDTLTLAVGSIMAGLAICACCIAGGIYVCLGKKQKNGNYFPAVVQTPMPENASFEKPNEFGTTEQQWPQQQQPKVEKEEQVLTSRSGTGGGILETHPSFRPSI